MSLLTTTTINLQIEAFTTRQSRNGLTPQATRELQQLQEITAFLPVASRAIKQGELLFELGYARNHIDVLSRLPLEDVEAVKLRVAVIAWL